MLCAFHCRSRKNRREGESHVAQETEVTILSLCLSGRFQNSLELISVVEARPCSVPRLSRCSEEGNRPLKFSSS